MPSPSSAGSTTPPPSAPDGRIPSTIGRIGLVQVFDYHGGYMPASLIKANGSKYDAVWASLSPRGWDAGHPGMVVSNYYIMGLDQYTVTHHTLSWWQANHPDWILYACTASGSPTHDIATMIGIGIPDMPLDIHNPSVVAYQVNTMASFARSTGYNALALDQVVFENIYHGGNPNFGQRRVNSEYGCGSWHGSTFIRDYSSPSDTKYAADVVAYVRQARSILHGLHMSLIVNHPGGSINDPSEQQLLSNTDAVMDETGFSDYGNYTQRPSIVPATLAWMRYAQAHGTAVLIVNKYLNFAADVTGAPLEYAIATYLLGNEGAALLFVGGAHGYGTLQYHPEYAAPIGKPCGDLTGGPTVFMRRFTGGLVIVNAALSSTTVTLPAGKGYRDIETRPVSATVGPMTGTVLLTSSNGCSLTCRRGGGRKAAHKRRFSFSLELVRRLVKDPAQDKRGSVGMPRTPPCRLPGRKPLDVQERTDRR